ncbi:HHL270Cp [Eremothecium sinecaudum]|uniref:Pre-mRNA-splicing factor SYF1 n=1 Tax=Eremothecium sinecaudum TaxID=45286 RepID=A0A120K2T1_9SACH|nr:HHL270Cp [Eremothecium sinecaudum]AMD22500.1 HHL270Cp [Eremothecium sinecaudum]
MDTYVKDQDLACEYSVLQEPNNAVNWSKYIASKRDNPIALSWIYERCLTEIPDNWDIWNEYLKLRISYLNSANAVAYHEEYEKVNGLFRKCLVHCNKVPQVWTAFLEFCILQGDLKLLREVLHDALRTLSLEFHSVVWEPVIDYIDKTVLPEEFSQPDEGNELSELLRRGLFGLEDLKDDNKDIWSSYMISRYAQISDDIDRLLPILKRTNDQRVISEVYDKRVFLKGFEKNAINLHDKYLTYITSLDYTGQTTKLIAVIERCSALFPEQASQLDVALSKHYVRIGELEKATKFLADKLCATVTSKDFSVIYDFLVLLEENVLEVILEHLKENPDEEEKWAEKLNDHSTSLEDLISRHPILLNDLHLRQTPNEIQHWMDRVSLFPNLADKAGVYADAIRTLDPSKQRVPGELGKLWANYAHLYADNNDYTTAKEIFDKALNVGFRFLSDVEVIWSKWISLEIIKVGLNSAIRTLKQVLDIPPNAAMLEEDYESKKNIPAQTIVFKSFQLWSLLLDLLKDVKDHYKNYFEDIQEAYENMFKLKIATPAILIDYAHTLKEYGKVRESFSVYERAIETFPSEAAFEIWNIYLAEAMESSLSKEEIRDLFERALKLADDGLDCKAFFLLYSKFEKNNGMAKRSVDILHLGCQKTKQLESKCSLWKICLITCRENLGDINSRYLYEECIQALPNSKCTNFVLDFAKMEESLEEYARVRSILTFGAKLLHPTNNVALWEYWEEFELNNGNKETYKDMLKLKRELNETFRIDTEKVSKQDGGIAFEASNVIGGASSNENKTNPDQIL